MPKTSNVYLRNSSVIHEAEAKRSSHGSADPNMASTLVPWDASRAWVLAITELLVEYVNTGPASAVSTGRLESPGTEATVVARPEAPTAWPAPRLGLMTVSSPDRKSVV